MQFFHECPPSRHGVYNHRLQSDDESCPNRAKTHRSDCQNRVCNHPKRGRNQQSHLASSETLSNLHRLFSDHRTLQIRPNHQDWFYTLHWFCHRTCRLQCAVLLNWKRNDNPIIISFFVFTGFYSSKMANFFVRKLSFHKTHKIRIVLPWHFDDN